MEKQEASPTLEAPVRTQPLPLEFPGAHHIDDDEIEAVVRVLRSRSPFRYYGMRLGKEVEALEREFAEFLGIRYALAVGSGTNALSVALSALGVAPGQEVIVPAYLWVAVVGAVIHQGAIPVLADIDQSFCLNPEDVERKITPKTSGIILVHMSGAPGNAPALAEIARRRGVFLLEDCAQCNGGSIGGKRAGTFGDMAAFSFQLNKNMTSGEGGAVATADQHLYRRAVACHDMGYPRDENGRMMLDCEGLQLWGRGTRMDELRGAILRVQLRKLPRIIGNMRASKYRIRAALEKYPQITLRTIQDPAGDTGCFLITTWPDAATAKRVNQALRAEGIVTFPQGASNILMTQWGLHLYYNIRSLVRKTSIDKAGFPWNLAENAGLARDYSKGACPVADDLFERSMLLPIPSCLTESDENDIIRAFEKVLG